MMTLHTILTKTQAALKQALMFELRALGYKPSFMEGFLYAAGEVPVLLVAHLDTVHERPVRTICQSKDGNILMSPEGIGGDDRAGVYMILQLIKKHRCHVLFCEDEEVGGVGAQFFAESSIKPAVNYIVELDRRGADDAVFYSCCNEEFTSFVLRFGFEEALGTFSDISVIAPCLGVAAVNISTGYYHEHTRYEHINLEHLRRNIERVGKMVSTPAERFEYIEDYPLFQLAEACEGDYLVGPDGELYDSIEGVLVDEDGRVYEYSDAYGEVIPLPGFELRNKYGFPARYCY